jgi:outer membrane protein OmpA-like peptidoglycan-associated protein
MNSRRARRIAAAVLALQLAACATPQGSVVLLPERDGRDSAVVVDQGGKQTTLSQPYAGARLTSAGPVPQNWSAETVRAQFGTALAAQPQPPARYTVYFVEGRDELTEESRRVVDGIFGEIARRPVPDVIVIGHTDTVGSDAVNDPLSRQRAEVVRNALIARGVAAGNVVAVGRGKRELVVPTADGVAEPRNRRVEIQVR